MTFLKFLAGFIVLFVIAHFIGMWLHKVQKCYPKVKRTSKSNWRGNE
jgi:hypothetical protein